MEISVLKLDRRKGKTSHALSILKQDSQAYLICFSNIRKDILSKEQPDLKDRFITCSFLDHLIGMNVSKIIIDDADLLLTSLLLDCINFCLQKQIPIIATTTE